MRLTTVICNYNTRDALAVTLDARSTPGDLGTRSSLWTTLERRQRADGPRALSSSESHRIRATSVYGRQNLAFARPKATMKILNPDDCPTRRATGPGRHLDLHPEANAVTRGRCSAMAPCSATAPNCGYTDLLLGYTFCLLLRDPESPPPEWVRRLGCARTRRGSRARFMLMVIARLWKRSARSMKI
jgi:hypothetical protein